MIRKNYCYGNTPSSTGGKQSQLLEYLAKRCILTGLRPIFSIPLFVSFLIISLDSKLIYFARMSAPDRLYMVRSQFYIGNYEVLSAYRRLRSRLVFKRQIVST